MATIFSVRRRRSASQGLEGGAGNSWPSCISRARRRIASSSAERSAPWPAWGLVACAASPISSERLRDQVGKVATSSLSVTYDVLGRVDDVGDRIVPAVMEAAQMLFQRRVVERAEHRRAVHDVRGLRAPPHHAIVRIRAAIAIAEEAALAERGLDVPADRPAIEDGVRHEAAEPDRSGIRTVADRPARPGGARPSARRRRRSGKSPSAVVPSEK